MNEPQTAYRICRHLHDAGALDLDAALMARLRAAREGALEHQRATASAPVLAWAGELAEYAQQPARYLPQLGLMLLLLFVCSTAINQWQTTQLAAQIEEIDAAILTGDLPLNAYLDRGFDAWLGGKER